MPRLLQSTIAILSATALSGCAAMNSISWQFDGPDQLGDADVITVDAKQRHLIMDRRVDGQLRVCAEAAPDVFSALSSSLTGGFDFTGANQKAEAAAAIAESAATIERTQTVNLLRESFYRTCERWLSGAIESDEFHILAARDHRSMVAVLAIEQLTGVVKAQSTIISGPAARAISAQNEQLVSLLQTYTAQRVAAKAALDKADTELAAANVEVTVGETKSKVCDLPTRPDDADAATKYDICQSKKAAQKTASDEYQAALLRESSVIKNIDKLSSAIGASTSSSGSKDRGPGIDRSQISDRKIQLLAPAIEKIALTAGVDEALMFCISYLRGIKGENSTRETCNKVIAASAARDLETTTSVTGKPNTLARRILEAPALRRDPSQELRNARRNEEIAKKVEKTSASNLPKRLAAFDKATQGLIGLSIQCSGLSPENCATLIRLRQPATGLRSPGLETAIAQALLGWKTP